MFEIAKRFKTFADDVVSCFFIESRDHGNATCIMLEGRIIKSALRRQCREKGHCALPFKVCLGQRWPVEDEKSTK
ncbi:MAG: hypothetical protein EB029_00010 [Actinobacteria bacterium]|nr:hypothetical protein [Actinomycetota bacterium]